MKRMTNDAADLVRRAIAGNTAARAELWRRYRSAVAAVALAYRPRVELEDLVQETALAWVRALGSLRDPERFEPWLLQIARNVARSGARRQRSSVITTIANPDTLAALPPREHDESIAEALATLPEEYREPLLLKSVEGLSQRRIAELLGLPETTIETRLVRARRMLRERLEAQHVSASTETNGSLARERAESIHPRNLP